MIPIREWGSNKGVLILPSNNMNRADAVLNRMNPQRLDLLVLPELAFSGE